MKPPERIWIDDSCWYTHSKADADDEKRHEYLLASSVQELVEAAKDYVEALSKDHVLATLYDPFKRLQAALERMEGR
jgi:hypothetical protein